jgi:ABC-type sugar transport system permease subunit
MLVAILMYYPMARAVVTRACTNPKTSGSIPNPQQIYVGLEHYENWLATLFSADPQNSLYWTIGVVLFQNVIGLATRCCWTKNSRPGA